MEGHRKRLAVLLAVAAALSAVVVTSAIAHSVKSGAGTLNIYGYGPGDDVQENRAKYAAGVLSSTNVNRPAGDFNDQVFLARLASGDVPDLVRMSRPRVAQYASKGVLQPMDSCVKSVKKQYRAGAMNAMTYKGHVYGLPEFTNQITLIVNNDVARAAGVAVADIQTTNLKKLKQANKKLLKVENGRVTRIGFDPKLPEFFPLWVKRYGANLISRDGLHAQLNSRQAVAALAYSVGLINDHGGWDKFKAYRDTLDYFGRINPMSGNAMGATPFESFIYNVWAEGAPVDITAKYFTNQKGGPISMISGNAWAIPRGSQNPGLACKFVKAMQSVNAWTTVAKARFDLRKRQGRAFTGLYTANTKADVKIYEDIYQPMGNKQFDDAVTLLVRAPRYAFAIPLSPASTEFRQAWTEAVNRVLEGRQTPRQALDQAQKEAQAAINKAK
ncbi:MAG: extracellular solute-binding protein [Gaiellaceae bacterium]